MIEKLNTHYSFTTPASIHDEEALTALELAGRQGAKINEVVESQNGVLADVENQKKVVIPATIKAEILKYINNGDFDAAIDLYAGELEKRLNNLLGSVKSGSTSMDGEVIDARVGYDGKTHSSLGVSVRNQLNSAMVFRAAPDTDANSLNDLGVYFKSSAEWTNVPERSETSPGIFITAADPAGPQRKIQFFVDYNDKFYYRHYAGTQWGTWHRVCESGETLFHMPERDTENVHDMNEITDTRFCVYGSSHKLLNSPSAGGLLLSFKGLMDHQLYQVWIDNINGGFFFRNYVYGSGWAGWSKLANSGETTNAGGTDWLQIEPSSPTKVYVYQHGIRGYFRYSLIRHTTPTINLDVWRLGEVVYFDRATQTSYTITDVGADQEGVVLVEGAADHIGGVHGDEVAGYSKIFVDGVRYDFDKVPALNATEIILTTASDVYFMGSTEKAFKRYKQIHFTRDGVRVVNRWEALSTVKIKEFKAGMLSLNKNVAVHYFDEAAHIDHIQVPTSTTSQTLINDTYHPVFHVIGKISAKHWLENNNGAPENDAWMLHDYGARIKNYIMTWCNTTVNIGDVIQFTNCFKLTC